jgi:hypothetical protein
MSTLIQDLKYGLRMLAKNPGFTAVAVITLALGIGVNVAIFSLVDQLLLWSIPAREPSRLVKLEGIYSEAYPFYCEFRDHNQVFSSVFASSNQHLTVGMRPEGAPAVEVGHVQYVSGSYFQTLGLGLVGALAMIRLVASLLYGVAPSDPGSIVLAVVAMLAVSLLATTIPARRATKVDPMVALRYE